MLPQIVEIQTPSRLHLGMLSFGHPGVRQFGGVGIMIQTPGLRVRISRAETFQARGRLAHRVGDFLAHIACGEPTAAPPPCLVQIEHSPPQHIGLGTGTQLGMALALGWRTLNGLPELPAPELARLIGRGMRSAIGLHGFLQGGLLLETGKLRADEISPLFARVELPEDWRFVLMHPRDGEGLSGAVERRAFRELPPVDCSITDRLCRLAILDILPAARDADFQAFSDAVHEYGHKAGSCFSSQQEGGSYATSKTTDLVHQIRSWGIRGVGQSSWGPLVFAILPDATTAMNFVHRMRQRREFTDLTCAVSAPDNHGARVSLDPVTPSME